jgi:hypothetical protein
MTLGIGRELCELGARSSKLTLSMMPPPPARLNQLSARMRRATILHAQSVLKLHHEWQGFIPVVRGA